MPQTALATQSGTGQTWVSSLEIGVVKHISKPARIRQIADALQCDRQELIKLGARKKTPKPKSELGKLICSRLEELDLTPEELAEMLNITYAQVKEWIYRKAGFSYTTLKPLARALQLPSATLGKFAHMGKEGKPADGLGELVRAQRKMLGWSQEQLGVRAGTRNKPVSKQVISQIESGKIKLYRNVALRKRLAKALGLEIAVLQNPKSAKQQETVTNAV